MSTGGAGEAPLIAGKIHGVRKWKVEGPWLLGPFSAERWMQGGVATEARCAGVRHGPAPLQECTCGLYAYHPQDSMGAFTPGQVTGVIEAWGKVELYRNGFRAQYARPVALLTNRDPGDPERRRLEIVAHAYQCELVPIHSRRDLLEICEELRWGLSSDVVEELVPAPAWQAPKRVPSPLPPALPRARRPPTRGEKARNALALAGNAVATLVSAALMGVVCLGYLAFWATCGLFVLSGVTGESILGIDLGNDPAALVETTDVEVRRSGLLPNAGGRGMFIVELHNPGQDSVVEARPRLTVTDERGARTITPRDFAYPVTIPAGGTALALQPLEKPSADTRVKVEGVYARNVDKADLAPATVDAKFVPQGNGCALVAQIDAEAPLTRLDLDLVALDDQRRSTGAKRFELADLGTGRSRRELADWSKCPRRLPDVLAYPAFRPGQLIDAAHQSSTSTSP